MLDGVHREFLLDLKPKLGLGLLVCLRTGILGLDGLNLAAVCRRPSDSPLRPCQLLLRRIVVVA